MESKDAYSLLGRYLALILLGIFIKIFYIVFTPLTVYPVFWFSYLVDNSTRLLAGNLLFFKGAYAEIIPACVAGAAYYLLLILNLTTPMDIKKRMKSISFLILAFLTINVTRIFVFLALLINGYEYFDLAHKFTWYFGSTIMVVLVWFANVWIFNIKNIPIYTDFKKIFLDIGYKNKNRS